MTRSQKVAIGCGSVAAVLIIGFAAAVLSLLGPPTQSNKSALAPMRFGLSNRVEVANHQALQFHRGPFTISFWFRTTTQQSYLTFLSKRANTMGDGWVIHAQQNDTFLFYTAGCASPTSSPQSFRDGQWHHFVAMRNGQSMTLYFDNRNVGSGPDICDHNEMHNLRLGMDADEGWSFDGELAEVHIYNRALSDAEIAQEWNEGKGRKTSVPGGGLVAGYRFEDASGGNAFDFSGNGHNGRLVRSSGMVKTNDE
jgi:sialidase-1